MTPSGPWWRGGTIYQIYVRSFADGDGDGVGDLAGVADRIDYLRSLGVDAVWLSPVFPSGGVDGGYDVTDYGDVDPVYGGLAGLDALLDAAHRAGLRVLLDVVPNHTSVRHPWFVEARSSRRSPRRDWYVWADGAPGSPPNNWRSSFGGPAWVWDEGSGQHYLASFYPEQADLNWRNPAVRAELTAAMAAWIGRGVDGFRIDVVHKLAKDPGLADNPEVRAFGVDAHAELQHHVFDEGWPELHGYLAEMRAAVGGDALLLGEVWMLELGAVFDLVGPRGLDLAFNFLFAMGPWSAASKGGAVRLAESLGAGGRWPCYHLSNHDEPRLADRHGERAVRSGAVLLLTLRGTAVLYQGEELGLSGGEVPPDRRVDRAGRDPQRTPVPWGGGPNAGFCPAGVEPWLPVGAGAGARSVAAQEGDPDSVLALYRRLLALRRGSPALRAGSYRELPAPPGCLAYRREVPGESLDVAVSFADRPLRVDLGRGEVAVATTVRREGLRVGGPLTLKPGEALVVRSGPGSPRVPEGPLPAG